MSSPSSSAIYDSAAREPPFWEELHALLTSRHLLKTLIHRDFIARYKRSSLGIAWSMLNPLGTMIVLSVVFSQVFRRVPSYPAYILSGTVAWTFFAQTTGAANRNILWGSSLMKRIYLPRATLVVAIAGANLINLAITFIPLLLLVLVFGIRPGVTLSLLPLAVLCLLAFSLGVGLLLATVTTFFPDAAEFYQVLTGLWFYATPIIWPKDRLPPVVGTLLVNLNPMADVIALFRSVFYTCDWPDPASLIRAPLVCLLVLVLGWSVFTRHADAFIYRI